MLDAADTVRLAVVMFGGVVAGAGVPILIGAARRARRRGLPHTANAALLLMCVNFGVLVFIAMTAWSRLGAPLTARAPVALGVFIAKAALLHAVRCASRKEMA